MSQDFAIFLCFLQCSRQEKIRIINAVNLQKPKTKLNAVWAIEEDQELEMWIDIGIFDDYE